MRLVLIQIFGCPKIACCKSSVGGWIKRVGVAGVVVDHFQCVRCFVAHLANASYRNGELIRTGESRRVDRHMPHTYLYSLVHRFHVRIHFNMEIIS